MQADPMDLDPPTDKPRAVTVIGMFIAAAAMISYLFAYAFTDALVKAEFLSPWTPGDDPRPRRFGIGFGVLLGTFSLIGGFMRFLGGRHLRSIDRMEEESETS